MPDPGWLLSQLSNPRNIFDILVVAVIIYWLLWFAQGTRATQLIRGIVLLLALAFIFGTTFQLTALNWVGGQLGGALPRCGSSLVTAALLGANRCAVQLGDHAGVRLVDRGGAVPGAPVSILTLGQDLGEGGMGFAPLDASGG